MRKQSKEYYRQYRAKNKEKIAERMRLYHDKHKDIVNKRSKEWYQRHKDIVSLKKKQEYYTPKGRYEWYRLQAIKRKISFELTFDQFCQFWEKSCVFGCKIETIGLDRIDNRRGYVAGNIQSMCFTHNHMKSNLTTEDFYLACKKVVEVLRQQISKEALIDNLISDIASGMPQPEYKKAGGQ